MKSVINAGALTVEGVGAACGAGTDCGSCQGMIEDMIDEALESGDVRHDAHGRTHLTLSHTAA